MKKTKFLSKNIFLFALTAFVPKVLSFFLVPMYTNILTTAQYGIIDLVTTTVSLLLPLLTINIAEGVMRFTLTEKTNNKFLVLGVIITSFGILILGGLILLLKNLIYLRNYKEWLWWLFLIFAGNAFFNLLQFYLRAVDKTIIMVVASVLNSLVMLSANILTLLVFRWGIKGYLCSMFFGYLTANIIMASSLVGTKIRGGSLSDIKGMSVDVLKYCIPTVFTSLSWWINASLDRYFVVGLCGTEQNGIYSMAYKIPNILGILQAVFVQAWTLSAIVEFDKEDKDGFFGKTYDVYNSLMVLACAGIILLNIPLSKILYQNEFFEAWHYVPLLLISSLFSALNGYIGSIFSAVKDTKICAYSTIASAITNTILNIILIPRYQIFGAAVATMVAYVVAWLIRFIVSRKYIRMQIQYRRELVAYILLIVQMFLALYGNKYIILQILILSAQIVVLYPCFMSELICKLKKIYNKQKE